MKEKTAKIIRIITIPPIEALVMLLILYGLRREEFGTSGNLLMAILFLTVIPIASYPIAARRKNKEGSRKNQRKMAFIFNFVSYLAVMVIGYCVGCNKMLQGIFNAYFLSVLVLTIVNKGFKIKASGHACSCTLPYLILTYYFSGYVTVICLLLYLVEFWASIELKQHTVKEFLGGTIVAWVIFAVTFCMM